MPLICVSQNFEANSIHGFLCWTWLWDETHHLAIDSEHIIMHLHFRPRTCLEDWRMAFPFLSGSPITEDPRDVCRMMWLGIMQRSGPPCKNKPNLGGISNKCILDQLSLQITHQGLPKSWLWLNHAVKMDRSIKWYSFIWNLREPTGCWHLPLHSNKHSMQSQSNIPLSYVPLHVWSTLVSPASQNIFSESHVNIPSFRKGPIDYKLN